MGLFDLLNTAASFLQNRGDEINMKHTNTDRMVLTMKHDNQKYSKTIYPNGTTVETLTNKN